MVLVDTSVWVEHFRCGGTGLEALLADAAVYIHPFIIGELACGNLKNRQEILLLLKELPMSVPAEDEELLRFIEQHKLMGKGLGYIDLHLLVSAKLTGVPLWTLDKGLNVAASGLLSMH